MCRCWQCSRLGRIRPWETCSRGRSLCPWQDALGLDDLQGVFQHLNCFWLYDPMVWIFSWKDSSRCIRLCGICAVFSAYCVHTGRWLGCAVEAFWGNWQWYEPVWEVPAAHTSIRPASYLLCPKILTGNRLFETPSWWVLLLLRETQAFLVKENNHQGWELLLTAVFTEPYLEESSTLTVLTTTT